jgi:hypothetical protein
VPDLLPYQVLISDLNGSKRQIVQTESYDAARRIAAHRVRQNASRYSTQVVYSAVIKDGETLCEFFRREDKQGKIHVSERKGT